MRDRFWALEGLKERLPAGDGAVLFAGVVPTPAGGWYEWQWAPLPPPAPAGERRLARVAARGRYAVPPDRVVPLLVALAAARRDTA